MSNSVSIARLPLDPELLGELIEKLPNEVIEQLTHKGESKLETLVREGKRESAFASDAGDIRRSMGGTASVPSPFSPWYLN